MILMSQNKYEIESALFDMQNINHVQLIKRKEIAIIKTK